MHVLHLCLNVADVERSAMWYTEQLGFDRSWAFTSEDGHTENVYVVDDETGVELQLSETDGETPSEHGDMMDHLALEVDDLDAAVERIDHHGIESPPTEHPSVPARFAFIADPDGHRIELIEPLE